LEVEIRASYRFFVKDGVPAVEPVGYMYVHPDSNFLYDFGSLLLDVTAAVGGAVGGMINVIPDMAGKDQLVDLVPQTIPSDSSVESQMRAQLTSQVPAIFRAQALSTMIPPGPDGYWQSMGLCAKGDVEAQRDACYAQRTGPMREEVRKRLMARGMSPAM